MSKDKLTIRQQEILNLIVNSMEQNGAPPTRAEIAKTMGFLSPNAAEDHLKALEKKGMIELIPGTSRGIRVKSNPGIAVINNIQDLTEQNKTNLINSTNTLRYRIDANLFSLAPNYLLSMPDASMQLLGIYSGDLLAIHSCNTAKSGDIVLVRLTDNSLLVRKFVLNENIAELLPANETYNTLILDLRDHQVKIEGVVSGIIRAKL